MPAHPVAHGLIRAAGVPIAAPSANLFTRPSPTRAADVAADLTGRLPLILDGGPTAHGVESSVVDLTTSPPRLLRPGAVPPEALRRVLPDLRVGAPDPTEEAARHSPGTMLTHYAPRATVLLFDGPDGGRVLGALAAAAAVLAAAGSRPGLLLPQEDLAAFAPPPAPAWPVADLGPAADSAVQATRLFAALRDLDSAGATHILARAPGSAGLGLTLRDRLFRAASGRVQWVP
jgi:L-threonylcarbamoyladenylate synthase